MGTLRKLAGQTAVYGLSTIVGRILNYLLVPLYTRVFMASEYGVVSELYAYVTFLNIIYIHGMETGFFHFANKHPGNRKKIFSTAFFSLFSASLLFTLLLLVFLDPLSVIMRYQGHADLLMWTGLIIALDTLAAIPFASLRQKEKPTTFALIKLANIGVNILFNLFFLLLCPWLLRNGILPGLHPIIRSIYSPEIGVGYVFISNLIASALTVLFLYREIFSFSLNIDPHLWKKMLRYSTPLILVGLAGMVNETLDRILLKYLLPYSHEVNMAKLGIYGACYKLSVFMTLAIQAFRFAGDPFFFAEARKQEDPKPLYARVLTYFVFLEALIFLGVTLYIDVFKLFIGDQGAEYYEGLHIVPILLMANLFLGIFYNLSVWYKLTGQNRLGAVISVGGAVVTIVLNILWIPVYGYTGSAWATFFCYFIMAIASYLFGQRFYPVPYQVKKILFYLGLAVGLYFLARLMKEEVWGGWNIKTFVFNTFLIILYALIFMVREKVKYVLNLLTYFKI